MTMVFWFWLFIGGMVLAGLCCMAAHAMVWWRSSTRKLHGSPWWARL